MLEIHPIMLASTNKQDKYTHPQSGNFDVHTLTSPTDPKRMQYNWQACMRPLSSAHIPAIASNYPSIEGGHGMQRMIGMMA